MTRIILLIVFVLILFIVLYDVYKTRRYTQPRQIILAIIGALVLMYILYTCKTDNAS